MNGMRYLLDLGFGVCKFAEAEGMILKVGRFQKQILEVVGQGWGTGGTVGLGIQEMYILADLVLGVPVLGSGAVGSLEGADWLWKVVHKSPAPEKERLSREVHKVCLLDCRLPVQCLAEFVDYRLDLLAEES